MPFPGQTNFPGTHSYPGLNLYPGLRGIFFTPPVVVREFQIEGGLIGRLQYGLQVMRINGEWVETEFPTAEQEAAADLIFAGGSRHHVDSATAQALIAAGYEPKEMAI